MVIHTSNPNTTEEEEEERNLTPPHTLADSDENSHTNSNNFFHQNKAKQRMLDSDETASGNTGIVSCHIVMKQFTFYLSLVLIGYLALVLYSLLDFQLTGTALIPESEKVELQGFDSFQHKITDKEMDL